MKYASLPVYSAPVWNGRTGNTGRDIFYVSLRCIKVNAEKPSDQDAQGAGQETGRKHG